MSDIFLATLGQRPEAITLALDVLKDQYPISKAVIIHTNPRESGISDAYSALHTHMQEDYPMLTVIWREIRHANDMPLDDIDDEYTGTSYFRGMYDILMDYRDMGALHLLVAGGRKVMSVYATLAAALVFSGRDFLWSIHSPPELVNRKGQFHVPPMMRERVRLVRLPLRPIHIWKDGPPIDLEDFFRRQWDVRTDFLSRLTEAERELTLTIERHENASNKELGELLHKSDRTIENQLSSVYGKLFAFLDNPVPPHDKRKVLLALLHGEL